MKYKSRWENHRRSSSDNHICCQAKVFLLRRYLPTLRRIYFYPPLFTRHHLMDSKFDAVTDPFDPWVAFK